NTILFLNKADIFLKSYLFNNLTYNNLIFIFLYKLKYYKGILFLITNRIK
ncbi:hypothetical protein NA56DRAFT_577099, partial [Hyaloscypha hepaticicola]